MISFATPSLDDDLRLPHQPTFVAVLAYGLALVSIGPTLPTGRDASSLAGIVFVATALAGAMIGQQLWGQHARGDCPCHKTD